MFRIRMFCAAASASTLLIAQTARADFSQAYFFANDSYTQTSAAAPTTPSGYFFSIEALTQNPGDFSGVTVTYPGPLSPLSLTQESSTHFFYGNSAASPADLAAQLPFGAYTYTSNTGSVATINYAANAFTSGIPALSAATWNALEGGDPTQAIPLTFNSFTPNPLATDKFTFLTITDAGTGTVVDSAGFLGSASTSAPELAPNTLLADHTYNFELDFSDRISGPSPEGVFTTQGFDVRTDGTFTTGSAPVPEPAAAAILLPGLLLLRRARRQA